MGSRGKHISSGHVAILFTMIDEDFNKSHPPLDEQFTVAPYESVIVMGHVASTVYTVSLAHSITVSLYAVILPSSQWMVCGLMTLRGVGGEGE